MSERKEPRSINKIGSTLLVKIPSDTNDEEVEIIQNAVLNHLGNDKINGVILDISQVEVVDSFFARTIAETTQMIDLMGFKTVVTGMRPSIAITTIELGFNLGKVLFSLNVNKGLELLKE